MARGDKHRPAGGHEIGHRGRLAAADPLDDVGDDVEQALPRGPAG